MQAQQQTQNLTQFCLAQGFKTEYDVAGHIHAGLRSAQQTKNYQRWNEKALAELQASRDAGRAAYQEALAKGEVSPPPKPTLEEIAANAESEQGQAAARLLAKRAARAVGQ